MDGFIALLTNWVIEAGIDRRHIYHKEGLELPGYFRPTHLAVTSPPLPPPSRCCLRRPNSSRSNRSGGSPRASAPHPQGPYNGVTPPLARLGWTPYGSARSDLI